MYNGGKNQGGVFHTIINQIPPHKIYIEPFLGSGAIIKHKKPAEINVGIELDNEVISTYHVLAGYVVINSCAISSLKVLCAMASVDTFIYVDPPYPKISRRSQKDIYKYELTDAQHDELLTTLCNTKAHVAISTYPCRLYAEKLSHWRVVKYNSQTRVGTATELLYMNYPEPTELHEYTFIGQSRTKRQGIQRKINRHVKRLASLPVLERKAILNALQDHVVENDFTGPCS